MAVSLADVYVATLYQTLLHRDVDPVGLAVRSAEIQAGVPGWQVALEIESSLEYKVDQVEALYQSTLGRDVDPLGLGVWASFLAAGGKPAQVQAALLGSGEYQGLIGGGTQDFLSSVYEYELGREPQTEEADVLGSAIDQGQATPSDVALAVQDSPEGLQKEINDDYQATLGRDADSTGQAVFSPVLEQTGGDDSAVKAVLLASNEFGSRLTDAINNLNPNNPNADINDPNTFAGQVADALGLGRTPKILVKEAPSSGPLVLTFVAQQGDANATLVENGHPMGHTAIFTVVNDGQQGSRLDTRATANVPWIMLQQVRSPSDATFLPGGSNDSDQFLVDVNPANLAPGTYPATITLANRLGKGMDVPVKVVLRVDPGSPATPPPTMPGSALIGLYKGPYSQTGLIHGFTAVFKGTVTLNITSAVFDGSLYNLAGSIVVTGVGSMTISLQFDGDTQRLLYNPQTGDFFGTLNSPSGSQSVIINAVKNGDTITGRLFPSIYAFASSDSPGTGSLTLTKQ
jgi:hypothetical protein